MPRIIVRFKKEMTILEALKNHPRATKVFVRHGMGCIACMGAVNETIEDGAALHGVDSDLLIKELNSLLKKNGRK